MRRLLSILSILALPMAAPSSGQEPWPAIAPGPHPVGFGVARVRDPDRPFRLSTEDRTIPRPIQVYFWYPADSGGTPITYGDIVDYVGSEGSDQPFDQAAAEAGRSEFHAWLASMTASAATVDSALGIPIGATAHALPPPGRYPLVILAVGRDDSPVLHAALAGTLASDGFVVVAAPGLGAEVRGMTFSPEDIDAQVRDLEALHRHASALPFVDAGRVAVVGFSYGGGSAVLYAMRQPDVRAVISLDGSIGFADRIPAYQATPGWDPDRLTAPVLHLHARDPERVDLSALQSLSGPVSSVAIDRAEHYDFTTLSALADRFAGLREMALLDPAGQGAHAAIVQRVRTFLASSLGSPVGPDSPVDGLSGRADL